MDKKVLQELLTKLSSVEDNKLMDEAKLIPNDTLAQLGVYDAENNEGKLVARIQKVLTVK
jgi:hypothetical protein